MERHELAVEDFTGVYSIQSQMAAFAGNGYCKSLWVEIKLDENGQARSIEYTVKNHGMPVFETGMIHLAIDKYNELP